MMRTLLFVGCLVIGAVVSACASQNPTGNVTEYRKAFIFDGQTFVLGRICTEDRLIVACRRKAAQVIDLDGGYIIPPFADAHTHHFDGPGGIAWQRRMYLEAGVFYAMTMTAPSKSVEIVRDQLSGPGNVDVSNAMGGITGPESHPAEIYEAVALGIYSYEDQLARADEIHASRKMADNAYFVVETRDDVQAKWPLLLSYNPDFVKVYLRKSERYKEGWGKWGAGGGIDPSLLPEVRRLSREADLRLAAPASSIGDYREALNVGADIVTHLPCYQDSSVDPTSPYFHVVTAEECLISREEASRAAKLGIGAVLISAEWPKDRGEKYVSWEAQNIAVLEDAGAPLAVGSDAYGSTVIEGLIAGAQKGFFEPARLLRLATSDTAHLIFPNRKIGCLQIGCDASFLVLGTNPLEDFSGIRDIRLRIKDGEAVSIQSE